MELAGLGQTASAMYLLQSSEGLAGRTDGVCFIEFIWTLSHVLGLY